MLEQLKNGDLIITNNKSKILKQLSGKLINVKIMSLKEFVDAYFGTYDERALYYLVSKYHYKYDVAKTYLDNFLFDDKLKQELLDNDLIVKTPLFKESIKRIVTDIDIDPYIEKEICNYEYVKIDSKIGNVEHEVYEFNSIEDEVNFVCASIIDMLKKYPINRIKLVNITDEYTVCLRHFCKIYNIPVNLKNGYNIYGNSGVQAFIASLKAGNSIEDALEHLSLEIRDKVVSICNKYSFHELDQTIIYLIEQELKMVSFDDIEYDNAIDCVSLDEIGDDYYFILGFNQDVLPYVYRDEDYLNDVLKEKNGIFTSLQKNANEKRKLISILTNNSNLTLSYKLKTDVVLAPSPLVEQLKMKVIKDVVIPYNYSHLYNKISLGKKIDNLLKRNIQDNDLKLLYSNYDIPYATYDNCYHKISKANYLQYINNKVLLSYSSLDNFYKCGFRYYLSNVLRIDKYEETFMTYIGNLFHYILSKAFDDNFDFEKEFNDYIRKKDFTYKEKFFIDKLKKDLLFTIDTINEQNKYSNLNNAMYEQAVYVNKDRNIKVTFMGVIDKLKYNDKVLAIIDYKTGHPDIELNKMVYGLSMQLPIYIYLAKNSKFKDIEVAGFYLQKILHNKLSYEKDKDYTDRLRKEYRLEGYSNSNTDVLKEFDCGYNDSFMIKGMKTTSKGFGAHAKVLDSNQMNMICDIVDKKIDEAIDGILDLNFDINPKKIDNELVGCEYCKFKDICHMKYDDIVKYKAQDYKEFLGGDQNA